MAAVDFPLTDGHFVQELEELKRVLPAQAELLNKCLAFLAGRASDLSDFDTENWVRCRTKLDVAETLEELLPVSADRPYRRQAASWNFRMANEGGYLRILISVQDWLEKLIVDLRSAAAATGIEMGSVYWSRCLNRGARHAILMPLDCDPPDFKPPCPVRIFTLGGQVRYLSEAYAKAGRKESEHERFIKLLEECKEVMLDQIPFLDYCIAVIKALINGSSPLDSPITGILDSKTCVSKLQNLTHKYYKQAALHRALKNLTEYFELHEVRVGTISTPANLPTTRSSDDELRSTAQSSLSDEDFLVALLAADELQR